MAEPLFTRLTRYFPISAVNALSLPLPGPRPQGEQSEERSQSNQQSSEVVLLAELEEYFPSQRNVNPGNEQIGNHHPVQAYAFRESRVPEYLLAALVTTWLVPLLWNLWKMLADL